MKLSLKQADSLDNLARAIDERRREWRLRDIKRAFAIFTASLEEPSMWQKLINRFKANHNN